jgi:predicted DNA-binding ribbon-helix-helix protein
MKLYNIQKYKNTTSKQLIQTIEEKNNEVINFANCV